MSETENNTSPASPAPSLAEYTASLKNTYDPEMFLGYLCWYTVNEEIAVPHKDFVTAMVGIDTDARIPSPPRSVDVFRRACTEAESKETTTFGRRNIIVRKGNESDQCSERFFFEERFDRKGSKFFFEQVLEARFMKRDPKTGAPTEKIDYKFPKDHLDEASEIIERVEDYYFDHYDKMTPVAIRETMRWLLLHRYYATQVRAAVYFVPNQFADQIARMEGLNVFSTVSFHYLPLINDERQTSMLRQAFLQNMEADYLDLLEEARSYVKAGKCSFRSFEAFSLRMAELKTKTGEYTDLLGDAIERQFTNKDLINKMWHELLKVVE